jgi:hypothetical protein
VVTLAAIGVEAYISCDLLHELAGHGGVCIATGGRPGSFSTMHFQCFGGWQPMISAAGILANIATGVLLWLALRWLRGLSSHARYFLWLTMAYSLLSGWGYMVQSTITKSGDWANALRGFALARHWWLASIAVGSLFYVLSLWITAIELRVVVGSDGSARAWRIVLIPYFAAAAIACAAGALSSVVPLGQALGSAIGSTLGNFGLLLLPILVFVVPGPKASPASPTKVTRSLAWILTAAAVVAIFVVAIGPGVRFRGGR